MDRKHKIKGVTASIKLGICFIWLQRIGGKLLAQKSQEILLTLVHRKKPGMEGYEIKMKSEEKTDSWVWLCWVIWRWHTGGKVVYNSSSRHLVGDPYFISKSKCIKIRAFISWWDCEAGYIWHIWRWPEEFINHVRDRKKPGSLEKVPNSYKQSKDPSILELWTRESIILGRCRQRIAPEAEKKSWVSHIYSWQKKKRK